MLESSAAADAMKHCAIPLARAVGGKKIVGDHAVLIFDRRMHRVLDVDSRTEYAAITKIAVVAFTVGIQRLQMRTCRDIQLDPTARECSAIRTALAMLVEPEGLCGFRPVEYALATGGDAARHAAEPPVQQIEAMGGLVHEKAARICLIAVPAAKVIGAVIGIEPPFEIHGRDTADDP